MCTVNQDNQTREPVSNGVCSCHILGVLSVQEKVWYLFDVEEVKVNGAKLLRHSYILTESVVLWGPDDPQRRWSIRPDTHPNALGRRWGYIYTYLSKNILFMLIISEQAQDWGKMGVEFFFQLLQLGYKKFPHNTTALNSTIVEFHKKDHLQDRGQLVSQIKNLLKFSLRPNCCTSRLSLRICFIFI